MHNSCPHRTLRLDGEAGLGRYLRCPFPRP
ncbi:hypothetical protein [Amycolatopsis sulphurea]